MNVETALVNSLRSAAKYNKDVQVAPACILWPDRDRQWETVVGRLQETLPELVVLGQYNVERRSGPGIWLRCAIAGKIDEVSIPDGKTPILYLPGVSRQDLRAVENCPANLKPLAELQYRGVIWSQYNAKDWTILAFLKSEQGGLGLDVALDAETKNAMQLALGALLDEKVDLLRGKHLDHDYFHTLVSGDPVRDLLDWIDNVDQFRKTKSAPEWRAFVSVSKSNLGFNPEKDGEIAAAEALAKREGPWKAVWDRYCEAPRRYTGIPGRLRKATMPSFDMLADIETTGGWPQWNDGKEDELRKDLQALAQQPAHKAREMILELERKHGSRRELVWAELGQAPLARAIEHLAVIAKATSTPLAAGTIDDLVSGYTSSGWLADDALLKALASVSAQADCEALGAAARAIYLPWAEESARYLQKIVDTKSYPGGTVAQAKKPEMDDGDCIVFVDGLRYDTAKRLIGRLKTQGHIIVEKIKWAALPSVTATGKAAVTPVSYKISGKGAKPAEFDPVVAATGQSLKGGQPLKKLLAEDGWKLMENAQVGDGSGYGWVNNGDLDTEGHNRGSKMAKHVDSLLSDIADRITELGNAGWKRIRVVTDHGWLLIPGGLPKTELHAALAENKSGRCAAVKAGASTKEKLYPWFWDPDQQFALADGVSTYRAGAEYAHGGLSLQECLTLELAVSPKVGEDDWPSVSIVDVKWKGLRCLVEADGKLDGLKADIRFSPGDPSSSVGVSAKPFKENGLASVPVEDDHEGKSAFVVLIDGTGKLCAQKSTVIGGEERNG